MKQGCLWIMLFALAFALTGCFHKQTVSNEPFVRPDPSEELSHQVDIAGYVDVEALWHERSQELAGPVTAVAAGNITGSGRDIVAAAGGELYLFVHTPDGYKLKWRMVFDRYVTGIAVADLDRDGAAEVIIVGASIRNWNPNVPGFISIFKWHEQHFFKVAEIAKDIKPFWSVATLDFAADEKPEIVASNANAMYVLTWTAEEGLRQLHVISRFAGAVGSYDSYLAWRCPNGVSLALYQWKNNQWHVLWRIDGAAEWTAGTPAIGYLTGSGHCEVALLCLGGWLSVFDHTGNRVDLPEDFEELRNQDASPTDPVLTQYGTMLFGQGSHIYEFKINW